MKTIAKLLAGFVLEFLPHVLIGWMLLSALVLGGVTMGHSLEWSLAGALTLLGVGGAALFVVALGFLGAFTGIVLSKQKEGRE